VHAAQSLCDWLSGGDPHRARLPVWNRRIRSTVGGAVHQRPDHVPPDREQVDIDGLVERGLIEIVEIADESEAELFLQLALELDDGEARTLAIAASREWSVVTDDRKAQRVAARECPQVKLFRSLELLKEWSDVNTIDAVRIRELLLNIRDRASFIPGKHDPSVFWWRSLLDLG
jgi:hypothetical protein